MNVCLLNSSLQFIGALTAASNHPYNYVAQASVLNSNTFQPFPTTISSDTCPALNTTRVFSSVITNAETLFNASTIHNNTENESLFSYYISKIGNNISNSINTLPEGPIRDFLIGEIAGRLIGQGLANVAGLATLGHGTNFISWFSIRCFGTNPECGGQITGGETVESYHDYNLGRTFFAYDRSLKLIQPWHWVLPDEILTSKMVPKIYEFSSNLNLLNSKINSKITRLLISPLTISISILLMLMVPSIKIHVPDNFIDSTRFVYDKQEKFGVAVYTDSPISPLSIGTIGTIWNLCGPKTFTRMMQSPARVLTGVVQLSASAFVLNILLQNSDVTISLIAGSILGMI